MTSFNDLALIGPIQDAVREAGYETPTPVQAEAIPHLLEGHDLIGIAQTGTGKTAAFTLPLLQRLSTIGGKPKSGHPRALILAPTRELAMQIGDSLKAYGTHLPQKFATIFGGVPMRTHHRILGRNLDTIVATPGRLLDLMNQERISLERVEVLVLDEADRMLDMGFMPDIEKIVSQIPDNRQTLLFSATMPKLIEKLAETLLNEPVRVEVAPQGTTAEKVRQEIIFSGREKKKDLLLHTLAENEIGQALIFTRTKYGADRVAKMIRANGYSVDSIHGDKSQNARQRCLDLYKKGRIQILVATDIAARGIDVDGVTHVINYEVPNDPDNYVHRIGRTARAGNDGIAITFCSLDECAYLRAIEKIIGDEIPALTDHPFHDEAVFEKRGRATSPKKKGKGRSKGKRPQRPAQQKGGDATPKRKRSGGANNHRKGAKGKNASRFNKPAANANKSTANRRDRKSGGQDKTRAA